MTQETIAVACSIDDRYALPLLVMLDSLVESLQPRRQVVLHLLHRNLSPASLDAIASIVETNAIPITEQWLERLPRDGRLPPVAAAPLLLPELLPANMRRVLFLDADMLVLDDIGPLWNHDLAGRSLAAAVDSAIPMCRSPRGVPHTAALGIAPDASYFNAGVMLVDLEAWRCRGLAERAFGYVSELGGRTDFLHQEALNAIAWNDWSSLDPRWNVPGSAGRCFDHTHGAAINAPGIVHFAGRMKPWLMETGGRFAGAYARTLDRVRDRVPPLGRSGRDRLLGGYDRTLRSFLHPCERFLWQRRLL